MAKTIHGHYKNNKPSPTYVSWMAMRVRCTDPHNHNYKHYGAKGVTVCDTWLNSFSNFLADMGERPEGKTIDRYPNKKGNYEPSNCRWATHQEQQSNLKSNILLTHNGKTDTIAGWARDIGLSRHTLYHRYEQGYTVEQILRADKHCKDFY